MADISAIRLPDGNTYNIKDSNNKIFIAEKDVTTYDEVYNALSDGKLVFVVVSGTYGYNLYKYDWASANYYYFSRIHNLSSNPEIKGLKLDRYDDWTNESALVPKDKIFIAENGVTTYAEIAQALADGKSVFMFDGETMYSYATHDTSNGYYWFSRFYGYSGVYRWKIDSNDVWTDEGLHTFQSTLSTTSWTPSITRSSGGTVSTLAGRKYGNVVTLKFIVTYSTSVTAGNNVFTGKLTNSEYIPPFATFASTYYGGVPLVCQLDGSGNITCRVVGSSAVTISSGCSFGLTYIID